METFAPGRGHETRAQRSQWPFDSVFIPGLFVGIDLIFTGWTWTVLALAIKNLRLRPR
jgi:hypothetical protein